MPETVKVTVDVPLRAPRVGAFVPPATVKLVRVSARFVGVPVDVIVIVAEVVVKQALPVPLPLPPEQVTVIKGRFEVPTTFCDPLPEAWVTVPSVDTVNTVLP